MELRRVVARQGDEAEARMVAPQAGDRGHPVQEGHVQVHHDRVRPQLVDELERGEAVARGRDHLEPFLTLDERAQAGEEELVVVCQENPDSTGARRVGCHRRGR